MERNAVALLGRCQRFRAADSLTVHSRCEHMNDREVIAAVRRILRRQRAVRNLNVHAALREVGRIGSSYPVCAVLVLQHDIQIYDVGSRYRAVYFCSKCVFQLVDRAEFAAQSRWNGIQRIGCDLILNRFRVNLNVVRARHILDGDGVRRAVLDSGDIAVDRQLHAVHAAYCQLAEQTLANRRHRKGDRAVFADFARRLRIIRHALHIGDLPAGTVGRNGEAFVGNELDSHIGLAGQARDHQLVRDVILIYTVYLPLCDHLLVSSVFYGRRCREYDLAAAGNTCRTVLLRRNGLAVCRCSNRCAGICTLNIQGYIVVDRAVKYGLDCGISANSRQCQRIAGCSLCSTAVNRPFLEIVAIAARHCRNSRAAAALNACRFCRRRAAALARYRNGVCRALNQRCGNLSLCGYILDRISERCICRIGHLSDCRAIHLPCLHHIVRILRRYGEGYVRTGGNIAIRDRLAVCGDGDIAVSAVPHGADRNHCLEGDCNHAVFGYVQRVAAAAVGNRMTVYRPLVNLVTLIGFCGEGNLSAAVDLCAGCNRCTQRAVCRLGVRYGVLACAELCRNVVYRYVRLRETAVLDRPSQRIAVTGNCLAVDRPAGHILTCRRYCRKGERLAAACGCAVLSVYGDVIACGDVVLDLLELRCNVNRACTGRIRIGIGFVCACAVVTLIIDVPAFNFVARLYFCRELD